MSSVTVFYNIMHIQSTYYPPQDQYAFIHDALCDYLTCGDTFIPAHHLTAKIIEMSAVKEETNTTGFQDQFEVCVYMCLCVYTCLYTILHIIYMYVYMNNYLTFHVQYSM